MQKIGKRQKGFSMLEMLIALLVLAIGLLGIAALQKVGQEHNYEAYVRTQATMLAYEIMDRMRVNGEEAINGSYAVDPLPTGGPDCDQVDCTPQQLVTYDLMQWNTLLMRSLPNGTALIRVPGAGEPNEGRYEITITWDLRDTQQDDPGNSPLIKSMTWVMTP